MKISISNIGWDEKNDSDMYRYLHEIHVTGIEIAPTRIFKSFPYQKLKEAAAFQSRLELYELEISSIQSIWYGRTENIFHNQEELEILKNYTKEAIIFSQTIGSRNLVFGCPKNRAINKNSQNTLSDIREFFKYLGDFAFEHNTCLSLEPNPTIYNTNFINTTASAFELVREIGCPGFKVNVDLGTILENKEDLEVLDFKWINHIHISEPGLIAIQKRPEHREMLKMAYEAQYNGYFSIEMGNTDFLTAKKTV